MSCPFASQGTITSPSGRSSGWLNSTHDRPVSSSIGPAEDGACRSVDPGRDAVQTENSGADSGLLEADLEAGFGGTAFQFGGHPVGVVQHGAGQANNRTVGAQFR